MNSQNNTEQILSRIKQVDEEIIELQSLLSSQGVEPEQTQLHLCFLKGRRRGLMESLKLLNETWGTSNETGLKPYLKRLGRTPEEQLALNQPAMEWCEERLNALKSKEGKY